MENWINWDAAFENSAHIPGSESLPAEWAERAAAFRTSHPCQELTYGAGARNTMRLFRPDGQAKGLVMFVHGGYWRMLDDSSWSHLAAGPLAHEYAVAMPSYTLTPQARISQITAEIADAIQTAAQEVDGPIRLIGHSAGGHLVSRMVCADRVLPAAILERIAHVVSLSGLHDLRPLTATAMNDDLQLTDSEAASESPALIGPAGGVPVTFWVGASERPEFLRQTRLITEAWAECGEPVRDVYETGQDHFSVVEGLCSPDSALTQDLME